MCRVGGAIVVYAATDDRVPDSRVAAPGVGAMASQMLIVVGFLAATAAVIALARGSTARWERDRRAPVAVRAHDPARRVPSAGTRLRGAAARQAVDALRRHAAGLAPSRLRGRLRPTGTRPGPPARPIRRLVGVRPAALIGRVLRRARRRTSPPAVPPVVDELPPPAPAGSRAAAGRRGSGVPGRALLRRTTPRVRRRALALLHRHGQPGGAPVPQEESEDRPTAR